MIRPILIWRPVVLGPFVADVLHTRQNRKQFFPRAAADERPNILLVMVDDMGYSDIGCYGGEVRTPTLDAMAEKGVRLARFYNCAQCCPTRASLMTWLYPHQAGVGDMNDQGAANELWRRIGSPAYLGFKNRASSPCRRRCVRRAIRLSWPGNGISVRTNPAGRVSAGLTGISRSSAVIASSSPVIARDKRRGGGKAVKRRFPVDRRSRSKTAPATFSALEKLGANQEGLLKIKGPNIMLG